MCSINDIVKDSSSSITDEGFVFYKNKYPWPTISAEGNEIPQDLVNSKIISIGATKDNEGLAIEYFTDKGEIKIIVIGFTELGLFTYFNNSKSADSGT